MDISTYPALQAAFSLLLAAYRSQHESFEIMRSRWAQERQVGDENVSNTASTFIHFGLFGHNLRKTGVEIQRVESA